MYKDVNHVLYTDNWFTSSLQQLEICLRRGIHFIGTVQKAYFFLKHGQRQQRERGDYTSVKAAGFYVSQEINPYQARKKLRRSVW